MPSNRRDQRGIPPIGPARRPMATTSGRVPGNLNVVNSPGGDDPNIERSPDPARLAGETVASVWGGKPDPYPRTQR
jgi:hypothetical protein